MAKILIIDDDEDFSYLTKTVLVQNGFDTAISHTVTQAVEEIKRKKPDLILMDIMMPEITGADAVRMFKEAPDLREIPIVFLTGLVAKAEEEITSLDNQLRAGSQQLSGIPLFILCDDPEFVAQSLNNFLWVAFTRTNPSHDIYGINSFTENKHWGCNGPLVLDARIKPHHAPVLQKDEAVERRIDRLFEKGGSLFEI